MPLFINGEFVESKTSTWLPVVNPATNEVIAKCPQATKAEMDLAVNSSYDAFQKVSVSLTCAMSHARSRSGRRYPCPPARAQCLLTATDSWRTWYVSHCSGGTYQRVFWYQDKIAEQISLEAGKIKLDARGDVLRGLEVVEHATSTNTLMMGETVQGVSNNVDTYSILQPLGVCAGVTPFNFPAVSECCHSRQVTDKRRWFPCGCSLSHSRQATLSSWSHPSWILVPPLCLLS